MPDQRDALGVVAAGHASFDLRFDNPTLCVVSRAAYATESRQREYNRGGERTVLC